MCGQNSPPSHQDTKAARGKANRVNAELQTGGEVLAHWQFHTGTFQTGSAECGMWNEDENEDEDDNDAHSPQPSLKLGVRNAECPTTITGVCTRP